jgi:Flp pilus assembly protein TadG
MALLQRSSEDRGAAAVEFGLILPVLVLLLLGIVEFGYAFFSQITLTHAAREGVRVHALQSGDPVQRTRDAATGLNGGSIAVATTTCTPGEPTRLTATYSHQFFTGFFGNTITLTGIGEMRCGG